MTNETMLMTVPKGAPEALVKFLTAANEVLAAGSDDAEMEVVAGILSGTTAAQILSQPTVTPAKELINHEFLIHAYRFVPSEKADGPGVYMILTCSFELGGDLFLVSAGSKPVMAQVFALAEAGALPVHVTLTEADRPTRSGYRPQRLVLAEEPF